MSVPDGARGLVERLLARRDPAWDPACRPPPRELAPGLLAIDRRILLPGGVAMPTRAVAVALPAGGLAVASPVPLDPELERTLAARGGVRALLAPGSFHHLALRAWAKAFPDAEVWLAPGLATRRPELPAGRVLGDATAEPAVLAPVLDSVVYGPVRGVAEVALFHRPTRSLLLTDALFHLTRARGARERWLFRALGVWGRLATSRTARYALLGDRPRVRAFADALIALEPERLVPAHGEPLEGDVAGALRTAFADFGPARPAAATRPSA
ncbi:MAG: DUF4336 domain-containing protein [Myxococcota bacterium]|nr:DUF4336 domain-containing protein [Myxococcota bacterium]